MNEPLLSMSAIEKRFASVLALAAVDFDVRAGEVHALMGENGAGKSTLIKVLTGVFRPDGGSMRLAGRPWSPSSPADAQRRGVSPVYQEVNLIPTLSVAENILLGRLPRGPFGIRWRAARRRAAELLATLELRLDVAEPLAAFPIAIQQMVAIARAIDRDARLLILDEPTSSLDRRETDVLFRTIEALKSRGLAIIFITHFIDQMYRIADRVTVLRNGRRVGTFEAASLPRVELVAHMLGRPLESATTAADRSPAAAAARPALLAARGLARRGAIAAFNLDIHPGEVIGLAGLLGAGRSELARLLAGADRPDAGEISLRPPPPAQPGVPLRLRRLTPRRAIGLGIALTPEDRRADGIFPDLSVRQNIVIAVQRSLSRLGLVSRAAQQRIAADFVQRLNIVAADLDQPLRNLSGGNQQKVILARWLACRPRLLILDEPTRGIDVGAKAEIERLVAELAGSGLAVLFISAELDEVLRASDRILVLRDRRVVGELPASAASEARLMSAIAGDAGTAQ